MKIRSTNDRKLHYPSNSMSIFPHHN